MIAAVLAGLVLAQAAAPPSPAQAVPRTAEGHPDLNGVWSNASITLLNRPRGVDALVVDEAEARRMAASSGNVRRAEADAKPTAATVGAPTDGNTEAGYNAGWLDPGMTLAKVNGTYRTSWIVNPANGQLPTKPAAEALARRSFARQRNTPQGPEDLAPNDRCIIGSRGSGGPGMLNNLYNNNYQIVLTRNAVAIDIEMVHDVRIIPIFRSKAEAQARHRPAALQLWLGDSVAWWEGDALMVETTHVNPEQGAYGPIFLSADGVVTESFRRVSADQISYAFDVVDPAYYTQPWRAEMSFNALNGQVFEYACHEGNYAMEGILRGARDDEARAARASKAP